MSQLSDLVFVDRVHDLAVMAMQAVSSTSATVQPVAAATAVPATCSGLTAAERALFKDVPADVLDHLCHLLDHLPAAEWQPARPGRSAGTIGMLSHPTGAVAGRKTTRR
jgi:hypothetical protein